MVVIVPCRFAARFRGRAWRVQAKKSETIGAFIAKQVQFAEMGEEKRAARMSMN
jgi:hypothetical protein